jgi:hypothetical protein
LAKRCDAGLLRLQFSDHLLHSAKPRLKQKALSLDLILTKSNGLGQSIDLILNGFIVLTQETVDGI